MAQAFNLTAQLNLRGPANIRQIAAQIRRDLGNINASVKFKIDPATTRSVAGLNSALRTLNSTLGATTKSASDAASAMRSFGNAVNSINIRNIPQQINASAKAVASLNKESSSSSKALANASSEMVEFGKQAGLAVRRFAAFSAVTSVIYGITNSISQGIQSFIDYDKQLTRIQQVTGESAQGLTKLQGQISNLSTSLGVSSKELTNVALTLAQAGLSARDTERSLKALALSSLAPSFDDMNETVEGSIALMRQFGINAKDLEQALGAVNAVSAKFAVEASDIITAIQRTGSVFATASKGVSEGKDALNEFIAVFTSVRATTRESAETIATGLRTIFTRIQRGSTINALKEFGVNLTDAQGKFVGAYKAVELLSQGLSKIDPRSLDFSRIIEELGGFRQIGKVIPLIQQFAVAQDALGVAQRGQGSLARDAVTAQKSLANQISKVREEFLALFREIGSSKSFQTIVRGALDLTSALIKVTSSLKGLMPALSVLLAFKGVKALTQFTSGLSGGLRKGPDNKEGSGSKPLFNRGGPVQKFARGGVVPGQGDSDSVPAMLMPGEFVIRKKAVQAIGTGNLHRMNKYAGGGKVKKLWTGGVAELAQIYPSIANTDNYEEFKNKKVKDNSKFEPVVPTTDERIAFQKDKGKNYEKFEKLVSKKYGVGKPSEGFKFLDYPEKRAEAKFMQLGSRYKDNDGKGNNPETIAAKNFLYENSLDNTSGNRTNTYVKRLSTTNISDKPAVVYYPQDTRDFFRSTSTSTLAKERFPSGAYAAGGVIKKFAIGGKALGARSKFKELSPEDIAKLSTKDLIAYGKALARDIFTTGGAGMAVGHEFIEVPKDRIVPELEQDLVSYAGKRGFWREKVAPFSRAKQIKTAKTPGNRDEALASQMAQHADEVAAREQQWSSIRDGSAIDKYLLSQLSDPILSDYKTVRGGGTLSKQFHNTRLRKAVNEALENYDDFDYSPGNIDKLVSGMAAKRFAYGGRIQRLMAGGVAESEPPLSDMEIETRLGLLGGPAGVKETLGIGRLNDLIRAKVRGQSAAGMVLKSSTLKSRLASAQGSEYRDFISAAIRETESKKQGAAANNQNLQNEALQNYAGIFGGAGMYQEGSFAKGKISLIPDPKKKRAIDKLKGPTSIEIVPAVLAKDEVMKQARLQAAKANKADLNTQIGISTSQTAQDISQQYGAGAQLDKISRFNKESAIQYVSAVADALDAKSDGSRIFLDFDKTLAYGADGIGKVEGSDRIDLSAFGDIAKVKQGLGSAKLSSLSKKLISLSGDMNKKQSGLGLELLKRLFVVSARPSNTMPLIAQWLNSQGLNIPSANFVGVGGTGLSEADIAISKAKEIIDRGGLNQGSVFIDDDPNNLKQSRTKGIISKQYGATMTPEFEREATQEEGLKYQDLVRQTLASYAPNLASAITVNREGQSLDFPNGLGPLASTWFDEPKLSSVPTDVKRTITQSKVIENIANYLRIAKGYAFGGKVDGDKFEDIKKQIMDKYPDIAFRISKRKSGRGFGYNLLGALKSDGGLFKSKGLQFEQPSNLEQLIAASDSMADKLMNPKGFALGGLAEATGEMQGLITGLYRQPSTDATKQQKNFGKISLTEDGNMISAGYYKNDTRSGYVNAYKMRDYLYYVGLSKATSGYGPRLYDVVMEAVSEKGAMLTSDRSSVSGDAIKVWQYYFKNRGDVKKTPLKPDDWTRNNALIDPKLYGREETWPPATDLAWVLQSGYSKSPSLINDPESVIRQNQKQNTQAMALAYFQKRAKGGSIRKFAEGGSAEDTVPALLTPGEFVVNKKAAQKIGYSRLHQLNHADKIKGYNTGGIVGGIAHFAGGGGVPMFDWLSQLSKQFDRRPDTVSRATVGVDDKTLGGVKDLVKALNELGISASNSAEILNAGGRITYKELEKALALDVKRLRISGVGIEKILAAEETLAKVRSQRDTDVKAEQNLDKTFKGVSGRSAGSVQQEIYAKAQASAKERIEKVEAQRMAAAKKQQTKEEADAVKKKGSGLSDEEKKAIAERTVGKAKLSTEDKQKIYERSALRETSRVTGVSRADLAKDKVSGSAILKYAEESMKDRKTLAQMDKELLEMKLEEKRNSADYIAASASEQKTMLSEARKAANEEISVRREMINKMAQQNGEIGVGSAGMLDFRNSPIVQAAKDRYIAKKGDASLMGLKGTALSDVALATGVIGSQGQNIGRMIYGNKTPEAQKQAAGTGAAIEQAGTTLSTGLMAASQALTIPVVGPWIAGLTAVGTAAFAAADYFYDFTGSQKAAVLELEKALNATKLEDATDKLDKAFSDFETDVSNIDLQKALGKAFSERNIAAQGSAITDLKDSQFKVGQSRSWLEFVSGAPKPTMENKDYRELARSQAQANSMAASQAKGYFRSQINTGVSLQDITKNETGRAAIEAYGLGNADIQDETNKELVRKFGDLSKVTEDQRREVLVNIATREFLNDKEMLAAVKSAELAKAMEDADRAGRKLAQSFQRLFASINQSINRIKFESDQRKKLAAARASALNGKAELVGGVSSADRTVDILENKKAYSPEEYEKAVKSTTSMVPGEAGTRLQEATMLDATLGDKLNSAIAAAARNSKATDVGDAAKAAQDTGFANIDKLNISDELKKTLKAKLEVDIKTAQEEANKDSGGNQDRAVEIFNEKVANAADGLGQYVKGAQEATKQLAALKASALQELIDGINESAKSAREAAGLFKKSRDIMAQGQRTLKEVLTGQTESYGDVKGRMMGDVAGLTGGITDPTAIRQKIIGMSGQLSDKTKKATDTRQAWMEDTKDANKEAAAKKAAQEARDFTVGLNNAKEALDMLAESTELVNKALDDLRSAAEMQKNRENFVNQLLTNTPEEADKLNQTFIRLQRNLSGGFNNAFNQRDARKAYNDTLRQTGNVREATRAGNTVLANQRKETLSLMKDSGFRASIGLQMGMQNPNVSQADIDKKLNDMELQLMRQMATESGMMNNPLVRQALDAKANPDPMVKARADRYLEAVGLQSKATKEQAELKAIESTDALKNSNIDLKASIDNLARIINDATGRDKAVEEGKIPGVVGNKVAINVGGSSLGTAAQPAAKGGVIYASAGRLINFEPQGTDTVPAMLSPGEFVINAQATAQHLPLLQAINDGQANVISKGFKRGGVVYLAEGGRLKKDETIAQDRAALDAEIQAQGEAYAAGNEESQRDQAELARRQQEVHDARLTEYVGSGEKSPEYFAQFYGSNSGRWNDMTDEERAADTERYKGLMGQERERMYARINDIESNSGIATMPTREAAMQQIREEDRKRLQQAQSSASEQAQLIWDKKYRNIDYSKYKAGDTAEWNNHTGAYTYVSPEQKARYAELDRRNQLESDRQIAYGEKEVVTRDEGRFNPASVMNKDAPAFIPWKPGEREAYIQDRKNRALANVNAEEQKQGLPLTTNQPTSAPSQANPSSPIQMNPRDFKPRNAAEARIARQAWAMGMTPAEFRYARQQEYINKGGSAEMREQRASQFGKGLLQPSERQVAMKKQQEATMASLGVSASGSTPTDASSTKQDAKPVAMSFSRADQAKFLALQAIDPLDRSEDQQSRYLKLKASKQGLFGSDADNFIASETRAQEDRLAKRYKAVQEQGELASGYDLEFAEKYRNKEAETRSAILAASGATRTASESARFSFAQGAENNARREEEIRRAEASYTQKGSDGVSRQDRDRQELTGIESRRLEARFRQYVSDTSGTLTQGMSEGDKAEQIGSKWAHEHVPGFTGMKPEEQQRLILHYGKAAKDHMASGAKGGLSASELEEARKQVAEQEGIPSFAVDLSDSELIERKFDNERQKKLNDITTSIYGSVSGADTRASSEGASQLTAQAASLRAAAERLSRMQTVDSSRQIAQFNEQAAQLEATAAMSTSERSNAALANAQQRSITSPMLNGLTQSAIASTTQQSMNDKTLDFYAGARQQEVTQARLAEQKKRQEEIAARDKAEADQRAAAEAQAQQAEATRLAAEQQRQREQAEKDKLWVNSDNYLYKGLGYLGGLGQATGEMAYGAANVVAGAGATVIGGAVGAGIDAYSYMSGETAKTEELNAKTRAIQEKQAAMGVLGAKGTDQNVALAEARASDYRPESATIAGASVGLNAMAQGAYTAVEAAQAVAGQGPIMTGEKTWLHQGDDQRVEQAGPYGGATRFFQNTGYVASQLAPAVAGFTNPSAGAGILEKGARAFSALDNLATSPGSIVRLGGRALGSVDNLVTGGRFSSVVSPVSRGLSTALEFGRNQAGRGASALSKTTVGRAVTGFFDEVGAVVDAAGMLLTKGGRQSLRNAEIGPRAGLSIRDWVNHAQDIETTRRRLPYDLLDRSRSPGGVNYNAPDGTIGSPWIMQPRPGQVADSIATQPSVSRSSAVVKSAADSGTFMERNFPTFRRWFGGGKKSKASMASKPTARSMDTLDPLQVNADPVEFARARGQSVEQAAEAAAARQSAQQASEAAAARQSAQKAADARKSAQQAAEAADARKSAQQAAEAADARKSAQQASDAAAGKTSAQPANVQSKDRLIAQLSSREATIYDIIGAEAGKPISVEQISTMKKTGSRWLHPDVNKGLDPSLQAQFNNILDLASNPQALDKYNKGLKMGYSHDDMMSAWKGGEEFSIRTLKSRRPDINPPVKPTSTADVKQTPSSNSTATATSQKPKNNAGPVKQAADESAARQATQRPSSQPKPSLNAGEQQQKANEAWKAFLAARKAEGYASGGIIYANNGALAAATQGSDTVPAMLTPGEFVVNREAAQTYMPILHAINSGHFNRGGIVNYLANGGVVAPKYYAGGGQLPIQRPSSGSGVSNTVGNDIGAAISQALGSAVGQLSEFASNLTSGLQQSMEQYGQISQTINQSVTTFSESANKIETSAQTYDQAASSMPSTIQTTVTGNVMTNHTGLDRLTGNIEKDIYSNTAKQSSTISQNSIAHVDKTAYEGGLNSAANAKPMGMA